METRVITTTDFIFYHQHETLDGLSDLVSEALAEDPRTEVWGTVQYLPNPRSTSYNDQPTHVYVQAIVNRTYVRLCELDIPAYKKVDGEWVPLEKE